MRVKQYERGSEEVSGDLVGGVSVFDVDKGVERFIKRLRIQNIHSLRNGLFSYLDCVGCDSRASARLTGGWSFNEEMVLNYHCDLCGYDTTIREKK
jgi:hypothetical protein